MDNKEQILDNTVTLSAFVRIIKSEGGTRELYETGDLIADMIENAEVVEFQSKWEADEFARQIDAANRLVAPVAHA